MNLWTLAMAAWVAGVALQLQQAVLPGPVWAPVACALSAILIAVPALARHRAWRPPIRPLMLCLACALLAWGSTNWRAQARLAEALPLSWQDEDLEMEGRVMGLPSQQGARLGFDVAVRQLSHQGRALGRAMPSRVTLYWEAGDDLARVRAGQDWRWTVRLQVPQRLGNPGGFNVASWLFDKGVRATGSVRAKGGNRPELLHAPSHAWSPGAVDRLRQSIRDDIRRQVPDARLAGILAGLTIGDQAAIEREDWDIFRRTSVSHLISISGLHIAMVGWMASGLLAWCWRRSPWLMHHAPAPVVQLVSGVLVAAAYSVLAGWGIPAQRTVCMMAVWAVLRLSGRPWPWPPVWLASAVVVTAMDPWALHQAGFWLSFVAVGVLMSSGTSGSTEHVDESWGARLAGMARSLVHTQWLTTLSLTPLAAVIFQQVSVIGFLANLLAIPVFTALVTPLALGGTVWPALWSAAAWILSGTIEVLAWLASISWAATHVAMLPFWLSLLVVLAAWLLVLPVPWRWRLVGLPALLSVAWLPASWTLLPPPVPGQFSVVAMDVGQGTSVLVRTARHAMVFDTGPKIGDQSDAGERVVVPLLVALGVPRLDRLVISHRDADHVGGAASLVREVPVALLHSSLEDEHPLRQTPVNGRALRHLRCEAGQHWQWDGVDFTVLHPTPHDHERRDRLSPNALSCAIRVQAKAIPGREPASIFLAGDIETRQEADVLARAESSDTGLAGLRSTVLVVPHHGSKTSSTLPFLQAVDPMQAVIQVGRRNGYGHPSPQVVARHDELGIARVATPACGAFVWDSGEARLAPSPEVLALDASQRLRLGRCWRQQARHYWE